MSAPHRFASHWHAGFLAAVLATTAAAALASVAYMLWPDWPDAPSADAHALPIVVADTLFQVPPLSIRPSAQRHSGAQDRVDLVFLWPSLTAPEPATHLSPDADPLAIDRVFVTLAAKPGELPPQERMKSIYPRYLEAKTAPGPNGLSILRFRDGSPYQGEDLVYDGTTASGFAIRCNRDSNNGLPGMCLDERFVGNASVTVRFPRAWLDDWRSVSQRVADLVAQLAPAVIR
jgi:hypothetical protein